MYPQAAIATIIPDMIALRPALSPTTVTPKIRKKTYRPTPASVTARLPGSSRRNDRFGPRRPKVPRGNEFRRRRRRRGERESNLRIGGLQNDGRPYIAVYTGTYSVL